MINQKHIEAYYDLFEYLNKKHGLILLISTIDEIVDLSEKAVKKYNDLNIDQLQDSKEKTILYYF